MIGKFRFNVTFGTAAKVNKLVGVDMQSNNLKCYVTKMPKQTLDIIKDVLWKSEDKELPEEQESVIPIQQAERLQKMDDEPKKTRNVRITIRVKTCDISRALSDKQRELSC